MRKTNGEDVPTDKESAKLRQDQIKVLQQQLALIRAEIARLQADEAKKEESVDKEQGTPATANNLPTNSTFSIRCECRWPRHISGLSASLRQAIIFS
ncbi:MAG: FlxA-like family protein [Aeromonas veronii]